MKQFESCIVNILEIANIIGAKSVSIPAISSGIFSFPRELCAKILIDKVAQWFYLQGSKAQNFATNSNIEFEEALKIT